MDENVLLMKWCFVLFCVVGGFLVFCRIRDFWSDRFLSDVTIEHHRSLSEIPNNVHRFSLRDER